MSKLLIIIITIFNLNVLGIQKVNELETTQYWSHTNLNGCNFNCRVQKLNFPVNLWVGENLYKGPCNIQNAISLFEKSPEHKAILDHQHNFGVVLKGEQDKNGNCYIVFEFANYNF